MAIESPSQPSPAVNQRTSISSGGEAGLGSDFVKFASFARFDKARPSKGQSDSSSQAGSF
jgi:hypothetical protein